MSPCGMAQVRLHDDLRGPCCSDEDPTPVVSLEGDCAEPDEVEWVLPTVTVRHRVFIDYDDAGDPLFAWEPLFTAEAIAGEQRTEIDDIAGLTLHVVDLVLPYSGDLTIPETITVVTSDGDIYTVSKVSQTVATVSITAQRVEDDEALGSVFDGGDPATVGDYVLDGGDIADLL